MKKQAQIRQRIARLTSNILNPFPLSLALILLTSFTSTSSTIDAIKWALISSALSILPVSMAIIYLVRKGKLDRIFTNVRQQRTKIYLVAGLYAIVGCITLTYLKAPSILVGGFITGLATTLIFMLINLRWKISLHTAFVAALAAVLVIHYGWAAVMTVALVPVITWARIELKYHSLAQAASGAILSVLIVVAVFYPISTNHAWLWN